MVEGAPDPTFLDEFYDDDGKQMFEESVMKENEKDEEVAHTQIKQFDSTVTRI